MSAILPDTDSAHSAQPIATPGPLFVLVAGEASGDLLGADLMLNLRTRFPDARFAGIGGPRMQAAGMDTWYAAESLSVMGLVEVLRHLPQLLAIRRDVRTRVLRERPAAFVGIDAPDFNLGLERSLKTQRVPTVHYVSPSVWAWREKRVERIGQSADRVLCLFPMEPEIYARHGVDARFVGHPLARQFPLHADMPSARKTLGLEHDSLVLALLPGSRLSEISRLAPDFLSAVTKLRTQFAQLTVIAPMANAACRGEFERQLQTSGLSIGQGENSVRVIDGNAHVAMLASDVVLIASGTAALEAMLAKRPMVVAYRLAWLTYFIVKTFRLMRTSVYSLPNILAGKKLVVEMMQADCHADALAGVLAPLLQRRGLDAETMREFERLHRALLGNPQHDAAAAVAELISSVRA